MATGDQQDMFSRLKNLLPRGWFADSSPVLDALTWGLTQALAWCFSLYLYAQAQTRIKTATGGWLDMITFDFFGTGLPRGNEMSDASFRNRILVNLVRERGTRYAVSKVLFDLTGRWPVIFEPRRPADAGAYGGTEAVTLSGTPLIYKQTWNGNDLQYSTPRTNYLSYSGAISTSSGWVASPYLTLAPNAAVAPDGTSTATLATATGGGGSYFGHPFTALPLGTYTRSIYAKAGTSNTLVFEISDGGFFTATFNLANGTVSAANGIAASIVAVGNGWYRCSATRTFVNQQLASNTIYVGAYGAGIGTVYVWGGQVEAASTPTPYIPTGAGAVTVTDYTQTGNTITFSGAPVVGVPLLWSGSGLGAVSGNAVAATLRQFGLGDGSTASFAIKNAYATAPLAYGVAGGYGSLSMPYQAFVTAFRPLNQGFPNIAGYGSPSGGYSQGSQADYASLSQLAGVTDADLFAAVEAVRPISTQVWMRVSS